jgi:hypothetical protein
MTASKSKGLGISYNDDLSYKELFEKDKIIMAEKDAKIAFLGNLVKDSFIEGFCLGIGYDDTDAANEYWLDSNAHLGIVHPEYYKFLKKHNKLQ